MANVTVKMKDGTVREFKHRGRAGGSYTVHAKFENGWLIIEDEWYARTAIPAADVAEVHEEPIHQGRT